VTSHSDQQQRTHNIQEGKYTQPLELMDSGREDTQKDIDEMETGDEVDGRHLILASAVMLTHQPVETAKKGTIPTILNLPPHTN
jgi:hypothetical protein